MGSSASAPVNDDGTIVISKRLVEDHLKQFSEIEKKLKEAENLNDHLTSKNNLSQSLLLEERQNNRALHNKVIGLKTNINCLESEVADLKSEASINEKRNNILKTELRTEYLCHEETRDHLTKDIKDAEEKLKQETKIASDTMKILTNERQRNKDSTLALKKQCSEVKAQRDQLGDELLQLKKTKLFTIQTALDDLNKRADTISNKIVESVKNNNRDSYRTKFQTLKDENDRIMTDLETVTFTTRLYQSQHDALLKLQGEIDKTCMDTIKTIHGITKDCKKLINDYNSSFPDTFLKAIADHTKNLDTLENVNFSSAFAREDAIQEKILSGLSKEKDMLEGILAAEKTNNDHNNQVDNV